MLEFSYFARYDAAPMLLNEQLFDAVLDSQSIHNNCMAIAGGNLERKKELPAFTWQASFKGTKRANTTAVPSGLYQADFDHCDPDALWEKIKDRVEELGIVAVHKTASTHGIRIVGLCRPGFTTLLENQQWLADILGAQLDTACKDFARLGFVCERSYFYYVRPNLFELEPPVVLVNPDFGADGTKGNSRRKTAAVPPAPGRKAATGATSAMVAGTMAADTPQAGTPDTVTPDTVIVDEGIPDTGRTFHDLAVKDIVEAMVERMGGTPQQGERNIRLYQLCLQLCDICDRKPEHLFAIIPKFGLDDQEAMSCCRSACNSERRYTFSKQLKAVLQQLKDNGGQPAGNDKLPEDEEEDGEAKTFRDPLRHIKMPDASRLPPIIREFVSTADEDFKPGMALACLPVLGFLASLLRARYLDDEMQAPSFIVNIIAPAASGKSYFKRVYDVCMVFQKERDDAAAELERQYQKDVNANNNLPESARKVLKEPETSIRLLPPKKSEVKFLDRISKSRGLHLFSFVPEIDSMTKSMNSGAWANMRDIDRLGQDGTGGEYGQDYYTKDSVSGRYIIRHNILAFGTPLAFERAYPDVEDGSVTRAIPVILPDQFGKPTPKMQRLSEEQVAAIHAKVKELMAICEDEEGNVKEEKLIRLKWLNKALEQWLEKERIRSVSEMCRARDQLRRRAALIAFRAGMVCSALWKKLDKQHQDYITEFCLWVADYTLAAQMLQYSSRIGNVFQDFEEKRDKDVKKCKFQDLYEAMDDAFTTAELQRTCDNLGVSTNAKQVIYLWKNSGLIEKNGKCFHKINPQ